MTFDDPKPTGIHATAIAHLMQARRLMDEMAVEDPARNDLTLAAIFDRQFHAMVGSIDQVYKHAWHKVALGPKSMVLTQKQARDFDAGRPITFMEDK